MAKMNSKAALDNIIKKSRVHLYKPIQIAEILRHYRLKGDIADISDFNSYRNTSKKWRDEISKQILGRVCTSSQKFQDNLFESNAMPPKLLKELAEFNNRNEGIVEAYIYHQLSNRLSMVFEAFEYINKAKPQTFDLDELLKLFISKPGLKRSIDKVYEIIVYALFSTLIRALKVEITLSINRANKDILIDFEEFVELVLGLSKKRKSVIIPAKLFRLGATNAADRGLDMYANFGPAVQVKHITLSEELAEDVSDNISADKIVLVCLDGEANVIKKITKQLPFSNRIQGIITLSDLRDWYGLCFSAKYRKILGNYLLNDLKTEFLSEFPLTSNIAPFLTERGYKSDNLCLTK